MFGAFEDGMLNEMGSSLLSTSLVARTDVYIYAAVRHRRVVLAENDADIIFQCVVLVQGRMILED